MFKKLTLAAAAGAGYVLGAKAGKERYAQIESKFREIAGMPAVQNATATVKETATGVADTAKAQVTEAASSVSEKAKGGGKGDQDVVVDLGTSTGTSTGTGTGTTTASGGTGAKTGSTAPMAGAAPSRTAPDVTRP